MQETRNRASVLVIPALTVTDEQQGIYCGFQSGLWMLMSSAPDCLLWERRGCWRGELLPVETDFPYFLFPVWEDIGVAIIKMHADPPFQKAYLYCSEGGAEIRCIR